MAATKATLQMFAINVTIKTEIKLTNTLPESTMQNLGHELLNALEIFAYFLNKRSA